MKINMKAFFSNPKLKYGGYASLVTFAVVAAVLILNVLAGQLGWQFDMTGSGVFTLSQQTRDVVRELEEDVTIYVLARRNQEDPQVMEALELYRQASPRIRIETVDSELNPAFVARFDPDGEGLSYGSVIVSSGPRFRSINRRDLFSLDTRNPQSPTILGLDVERRVTNALIFVGTGRTPVIYQLTGHGEINMEWEGYYAQWGGPTLGPQFEAENFELRTLNLLQAQRVPDDASIVALVRPRSDITEQEADALREFFSRGGKGFFAVDLASGELPNVAGILDAYGIGIPNGVVLEPNRNYNRGDVVQLLPELVSTPVTDPLITEGYPVYMPLARPILALETKPRNVTLEPLLRTSSDSFYRTDLDNPSEQRSPSDVRGPVTIAITALERDFVSGDEITRIAVIGNVDFLRLWDQMKGNLDFLMNTFGWLEQQEETLSIRAKWTMQFPMRTTGTQQLIFGGLFVIVIPLAILVAGLVIWLRRRHL